MVNSLPPKQSVNTNKSDKFVTGELYKDRSQSQRLLMIALVTLILGVITAIFYINKLNNQYARAEIRNTTLYQLNEVRAQLEGNINSNLQTVRGLTIAIAANPNISQSEFSHIAAPLFDDQSHIRNIAAAPDLVIQLMHPLQGNEAAIGLDYRQNEAQRNAALQARDSGKLVLAGPVNLVQGGQGFIGRIPVFINNTDNNSRDFWGLISTVINSDELLKDSGVSSNHSQLDFVIRGKDGLGEHGEIFFGESNIFENDPVITNVTLPFGSWQLAAVPKNGWENISPQYWLQKFLLIAIGLLVILPFWLIIRTGKKNALDNMRLQSLFDLSFLGINLIDYKTGQYIDVNRNFLEQIGYSKSEILGLTVNDINSPDHIDTVEDQRSKLVSTGRYGPVYTQFIRKNGSQYPVRVSGIRFQDSGGKLLVWELVKDETDQFRQQKLLEDQKQQLELVINSTGLGIWDWDLVNDKCQINERWAEIIGYTITELGKITINTWLTFVLEDDKEKVKQQVQRHWSGETESYTVEYRLRHKDGHIVWTLDTGKTIEWDANGKATRMVGTHLDTTQQKSILEDLTHSQNELQNFFDLSSNFMCIGNLEGYFEKVNNTFFEKLGYHRAEIQNNKMIDFIHPDDVEATLEAAKKFYQGESINSYTNRIRCSNGTYLNLLWNTATDPNSNKIYASAIDITQQTLTDTKLAQQQELLSSMSELARIGVWEYDRINNEIFWGDMTYSLLEMTKSYTPKAQDIENFYPEGKHRDRIKQLIQTAIKTGKPWSTESLMVDANGREFWAHLTGGAELKNGECVRLFGAFQDINERKLNEQQLRNAHLELENQMNLFEAIATAQSSFIAHNDMSLAFDELLQDILSLTESRHGLIGEIIYDGNKTPFIEVYAITNRSVSVVEATNNSLFTLRTTDGLIGKVMTELNPIVDNYVDDSASRGELPDYFPKLESFLGIPIVHGSEGVAIVVVANRPQGFTTDTIFLLQPLMSTIGQIIEGLRSSNARERVELALISAKEQAESAARTKSEFLATMSHEIRTPMNGVLGMLNLLQRTTLDDAQQRKIDIAKNSAQSLLTIINDILDFTKIDAGKMELELVSFNIRQFFGDVAESMALRAQEKNLELIIDLSSITETMVTGDPGRLRQVLSNLMGNAIKFTSCGEIIVRAHLEKIERDERGRALTVVKTGDEFWHLYVCVLDTGIGIAPDKIRSLFDPFTQADASTTREFGGTGLGLAITKRICQSMGGYISVQSQPGKGSQFDFTVNLRQSYLPSKSEHDIQLENIRILIIDDSSENCKVLSSQLSRWGALVTIINDSERVIESCLQFSEKKLAFDLCLIDLEMPNINGIDVAKELKTNETFKSVPLVLMTPMAHGGDRYYFKERGFDLHINKPVTVHDLFKSLACIDQLEKTISNILTHENPTPSALSLNSDTQESNPSLWPINTRILLVEDNPVNVEVTNLILEEICLSADHAGNGIEALEALSLSPTDHEYSLILMDCQMPTMDGFETSRQIRRGNSGNRYKNIPIIALTANAMQGDKEKCLAAGMNDYLTKPLEDYVLIEKIRRYLNPKLDSGKLQSAAKSASSLRSIQASTSVKLPKLTITWDQEEALKMLKGREDRLKILLNTFCENTPKRIENLNTAVKASDCEEVRQTVHAIKGSAAQLKGYNLQKISEAMEMAARENNTDEIQILYPVFTEHCQALLNRFQTYIEQ